MKQEKINSKRMKAINARNILNIVRKSESTSRIDIAKKTGLTTGTVTNIINDLIEKEYVIEVGNGESAGGRKPVIVEINASAGFLIGVELNATDIKCVLGDFKAQVIGFKKVMLDASWNKNDTIDVMVDMMNSLIDANSIDREKIFGIGLAVPGPCDYIKGVMLNPPNFPDWINVPIRDIISQQMGIKTFIFKETFCAILGEYWIAESRKYSRILGVHIGEVGFGGGMLIDGDFFMPSNESMELGHLTVEVDGYDCTCGKKGCVEAHATGIAAIRYAKEMMKTQKSILQGDEITMDMIIECARKGDEVSLRAIDKCAKYAAVAVSDAICLFNPHAIYYCGEFIDKCDMLFQRIVSYINEVPYPGNVRRVVNSKLTFGSKGGAMGALALVFNELTYD